jgi:hypothetical protein
VVEIDRYKVELVVDNLLSNAIKFTMPGKNVHITVEDSASEVRVAVKDEGVGIPAEEHVKLFKPFSGVTVKPTGDEKSTGLGLAIAYKIIRAHGGEIGMQSEVGAGSTFHFSVPKMVRAADDGRANG